MHEYKYILFDLDGTLTDSKVGITKSAQYALAKYGIHEKNLDDLKKFIGPPLTDSFMEFYSFDENKARQAVDFYREYFAVTGIYENELYPGVINLLDKLCSADRNIILATSKPTIYAQKILEHFNIDKSFSAVVGSNMDGTRCAKGEVIEWILKNIDGIEKYNAVMVGDRSHDIIGAGQNGIYSIGVTYGYGSVEELMGAGAMCLVNNMDQLLKTLLSE